jgi:hypothetical protein
MSESAGEQWVKSLDVIEALGFNQQSMYHKASSVLYFLLLSHEAQFSQTRLWWLSEYNDYTVSGGNVAFRI